MAVTRQQELQLLIAIGLGYFLYNMMFQNGEFQALFGVIIFAILLLVYSSLARITKYGDGIKVLLLLFIMVFEPR